MVVGETHHFRNIHIALYCKYTTQDSTLLASAQRAGAGVPGVQICSAQSLWYTEGA